MGEGDFACSPVRLLATGTWEPSRGVVTMTVTPKPEPRSVIWEVGQFVEVESRTWVGINRPGGHGKIIKVHTNEKGVVESVDVKYTVSGGYDTKVGVALVSPYEELDRRCRGRATRQHFCPGKENEKENPISKKTKPSGKRASSTERRTETEKKVKSDGRKSRSQQPQKKIQVKPAKKTRNNARRKVEVVAAVSSPVSSSDSDTVPKEITFYASECNVSPLALGCSTTALNRVLSPVLPTPVQADFNEDTSSLESSNASEDQAQHCDNNDFRATVISPARVLPRVKRLGSGSFDRSSLQQSIAQATTSNVVAAVNRSSSAICLTLEDVYKNEQRNAESFIADVVEGRKEPEDQKPAPQDLTSMGQRQQVFHELLNHILSMDDMVEQTSLLEKVNELVVERFENYVEFDENELCQFIKELVDRDRIMISDGMILSI